MVWMPKVKEKGRRSGVLHKGKSTARQGMDRRYSKRSEEKVQNTERSMDGCHDLAKWLKLLFTFLFFSFPFWTYYTRIEHEKVSCN